jgi:hypothetical protein
MAANNIIQYQKWFGRVFRVIWRRKKNCCLISHRNQNTLWILEVVYVVDRTNSCLQKSHDFWSRTFDIICKNAVGLTSFVSAHQSHQKQEEDNSSWRAKKTEGGDTEESGNCQAQTKHSREPWSVYHRLS